MKGKLIVIDGTDGSGKATQSALLFKKLKNYKIKSALLNIPVYNSFTGKLVARYLKNEFGRISPYLATVLYAINRFQQKEKVLTWLREGRVVVLNRYVTANQIHQAVHFRIKKERNQFVKWVSDLEYGIFGLPKPDLVLFINMPVEIAYKLVRKKSTVERRYVVGSKGDLLESDLEHQREALDQAKRLFQGNKTWKKIDAVEKGKLLSKDRISDKIWKEVYAFLRNRN